MTRIVTSLTNPTVKAVRALHLRKEREQSGLFVAEGLKIVTEAVELGRAPRTLLYGKDAEGHPLLKRAIQATLNAQGEVVADFVRKLDAGMVVIGTRGHTGLAGVLLGSVAQDVIAHTKVPVTLVK